MSTGGPSASQDPGWGRLLRPRPKPGDEDSGRIDGLTLLRFVFSSIVFFGLVSIVIVLLISKPDPAQASQSQIWFGVVLALGIGGLEFVHWTRRKHYSASTPTELAAQYRNNFFIGLGGADLPLVTGLVGAIRTGNLLLHAMGLAFFLIAMTRLAPSRRNLQRTQERLMSSGSPLSITAALMGTNPTPEDPPVV